MSKNYQLVATIIVFLAGGSSRPVSAQGCLAYANADDQCICRVNSVAAPFSLAVRTSSASSPANQPIVVMPGDGSAASITLNAVGTSAFVPVAFTWTQVTPGINSFASTGQATFSATTTTSPSVQVSLPKSGMYQFQVTAVAADRRAVSQYVWVNAWEYATAEAIGKIGRNPGLTPPQSVRQLSADPGPFNHPRLFFSNGDWAELNAKIAGSSAVPEAVAGANTIRQSLAGSFDKPGTALNNLAVALTGYATNGYQSADYAAIANANNFNPALVPTAVPTILTSTVVGDDPGGRFADALAGASYLTWLSIDPAQPANPSSAAGLRLQQLAMLTAALANFLLETEKGNKPAFTGANSGNLASVALAYDLTYGAMTQAQQTTTRSYLYTIGNLYNGGRGGLSLRAPRTNPSSTHQNGGDFPNLAEGIVYPALAIEGEEAQVLPAVLNDPTFGTYAPAAGSTDPAVTAVTSWPGASSTSVRNLGRQVRLNSEFTLSPWGFYQTMTGYFHLGQDIAAPATLALARRGENQWVTTNLYQALLHPLYNLLPKQADNYMQVMDHHDGAGFSGSSHSLSSYYIAKYMFPDDAMVDFVYRQAVRSVGGAPLTRAIFATPVSSASLPDVAQAKHLGLMKFDPYTGFAISRNGWDQNDLSLVMNNFTLGGGHYHAQANSFSLSALGRVWATPPGYHIVPADAQQQVLIQVHPGATDASQGYVGQGPGSYDYATNPAGYDGHPFHGVLLEVREDPNHLFSWFSGDATPAYSFISKSNTAGYVNTGLTNSYMLVPGLLGTLIPSDAAEFSASTRFNSAFPYNPVNYAYRSILTVRGKVPYVLVVDDIARDGSPQNYRWSMNASIGFAGGSGGVFVDAQRKSVFSSLQIESGATATDAVLFHEVDAGTAAGLPRMLMRDVSEQTVSNQPAIVIDDRPITTNTTSATNLTYGIDNNSGRFSYFPSRRVFIDRRNVIEPNYKVLLFPYLTGSERPTTSWDASQTVLTVKVGAQTDQITFDRTNADRRTRLLSFVRTAAPLSVSLTSFEAVAEGPDARLSWATASEQDNARFEIERSADGQSFGLAGTVPGHGTTASPHAYAWRDVGAARLGPTLYYRLRQVDGGGGAHYSPVRPVRFGPLVASAQLYPNPIVAGTTTLDLSTLPPGAYTAQVFDLLGREVLPAQTIGGGNHAELSGLGAISHGIYLVRVHGAQFVQVLRVVRD